MSHLQKCWENFLQLLLEKFHVGSWPLVHCSLQLKSCSAVGIYVTVELAGKRPKVGSANSCTG